MKKCTSKSIMFTCIYFKLCVLIEKKKKENKNENENENKK